MRVDVIDLIRCQSGVLQCQLHGARGTFAIRRRRCHVIRVGRKTIPGDFTINFRAARLRVFQLFDYEYSCAFADYEAIAVAIKGSRRAFGLIVARAKSSHC